MDILHKELSEIYARQRLDSESLDENVVASVVEECRALAHVSGMVAVVTDASADKSFYLDGRLGDLLGLTANERSCLEISSSDEDFLYRRMVPADLVDLRMLEYEFFKFVDKLNPDEKLGYKAVADVGMYCEGGRIATISTQR